MFSYNTETLKSSRSSWSLEDVEQLKERGDSSRGIPKYSELFSHSINVTKSWSQEQVEDGQLRNHEHENRFPSEEKIHHDKNVLQKNPHAMKSYLHQREGSDDQMMVHNRMVVSTSHGSRIVSLLSEHLVKRSTSTDTRSESPNIISKSFGEPQKVMTHKKENNNSGKSGVPTAPIIFKQRRTPNQEIQTNAADLKALSDRRFHQAEKTLYRFCGRHLYNETKMKFSKKVSSLNKIHLLVVLNSPHWQVHYKI